jgi:alpha-beta hydrolase superfamily lysophospholipase
MPGEDAQYASEVDAVLGAPFTSETISLGDDSEGVVEATLVKAPAHGETNAAVLYVHGFCDYFFHRHVAEWWTERGYAFYALDLRKYGRSMRAHQSPNHINDISEYFPELDEAWRRITERDGHEAVVVQAHSTGGLTVPLWLHEHRRPVSGVVLNSPWLDMHGGWVMRNPGTFIIRQWASLRPDHVLPRSVSGIYGRSLHSAHGGEWGYDTTWKALDSFPVRTGWLSAVRRAHDQVHRGLDVKAPVLVLSSLRTGKPESLEDPTARDSDIVLDVQQIRRWSTSLGPHVTNVALDGALHDVFLSSASVRAQAFDAVDTWLGAYVEER